MGNEDGPRAGTQPQTLLTPSDPAALAVVGHGDEVAQGHDGGGGLVELLDTGLDPVRIVAAAPSDKAIKLAEMLGIRLGDDGWFEELNYNSDPMGTETGGIFVAGVCQGPKDIPDTVAQAKGAAASSRWLPAASARRATT